MAANVIHVVGGVSGVGFNGNVSLKGAIQERLSQRPRRETLTNQLAFEILDQIEFECRAIAFLTKPVVAIPLTFTVGVIGLALLETTSVVMAIAGFILFTAGVIGFLITTLATIDGELPRLAELYRKVADEAHALRMNMLENPGRRAQFNFGG